MNLLNILGYIATFLAILGSFVMASNIKNKKYPYIFWLISNLIFIIVFLITKQNALLLLNVIGLIINSVGYINYKNENHIKINFSKYIYNISILTMIISLIYLKLYLITLNINNLQWSGSLFSISAALILAAKYKYEKYCWLLWILSNGILFFYSLILNQYYLLLLQSFFMIINIIGFYNYFIKSNNK